MKKRSLGFCALLLLGVAVPAVAVQLWFSSAPASADNGASYYVETAAYVDGWSGDLSLFKYGNGGNYVSGNSGGGYLSAGTWQTDSGPQTIEYFAEVWDWDYYQNATDWCYITINPPANQAPVGICDYTHASVTKGNNLHGSGWAADNEMGAPISRVDILIDGNDVGDASLGGDRIDVANYHGRSDWRYSGWSFDWNTGGLSPGTHSVEFRAWDNQGASTTFGYRTFEVTNSTPSNNLLSPGTETIALGTTRTITANATDTDGNIVTHNLDIQRPDGSWNWQGGFAYGEPYMGGPVGSASNSTRSANFTFNILGTWYVRSWVNDANGNSQYSSTMVITVVDNAAPSVPTGLNATGVGSTSFTFNWAASTDNVGVTAYEVMRDTIQHGYTSGLTMGITGLAQNTTYAMKVRARDAAGNWSAWSAPLQVTTAYILTAPTNLVTASKGSSFVTLSWSPGTSGNGVQGYRVYRGSDLVATTTATSFSDWGRSASTSYTYNIKTLNSSGQESTAATLTVTTDAATFEVFTPVP